MPRPAVLPRRPAVPRPTRMRSWVEPGAGWRSWTLMGMSALRVFNPHEMRDLGQHPPDLGSVGQGVRLADAAEAEGAQGAALLGLRPDGRLELGHLEVGHQAASVGTCGPRRDSL